MSEMGFQKTKKWGELYSVLFWVFLNFAKPVSDRETRVARRKKGSTHAVRELEGIHRGTLFPLVIERQGMSGEGKGVLTQSGNLRGYTVEHSSPLVIQRQGMSGEGREYSRSQGT